MMNGFRETNLPIGVNPPYLSSTDELMSCWHILLVLESWANEMSRHLLLNGLTRNQFTIILRRAIVLPPEDPYRVLIGWFKAWLRDYPSLALIVLFEKLNFIIISSRL